MNPRRRLLLRGSLHAAPAPAARPPWAIAEERFVEQCTRCGDCAEACPRELIRSGDGGFLEIDFSTQGYNFCRACVEACGTTALDARNPPFTARVRVRVAAHCLARQRVECRACGDACHERVPRFVPARGGISRLVIDFDRCTGCGACAAPCRVGAITMRDPASPVDATDAERQAHALSRATS